AGGKAPHSDRAEDDPAARRGGAAALLGPRRHRRPTAALRRAGAPARPGRRRRIPFRRPSGRGALVGDARRPDAGLAVVVQRRVEHHDWTSIALERDRIDRRRLGRNEVMGRSDVTGTQEAEGQQEGERPWTVMWSETLIQPES